MTPLVIVVAVVASSALVGLAVGWVIRHHPPTDPTCDEARRDTYRDIQARMWDTDQQFDAMCDQARRDKDDAA